MDQPEDGAVATQVLRHRIIDRQRRVHGVRGLLSQTSVRPVLVEMDHVLGQDSFQMSTTEDQHPVEALTTNGPDEPVRRKHWLEVPSPGSG